MKNIDFFSGCHPSVNFIYFGIVIGFSMFFMHPVCLLISFISAVCYYIKLKSSKAVSFIVKGALPMLILAAVINPAFNHAGVTILCYLPSGNPLTLESIAYGIAAAVMLVSVLLWFSCYTAVMSSDKFVYLFGRVIPALSLLLSMTLRFVPRFKAQINNVREAQAGFNKSTVNGSVLKRIKNALRCFSATVTWSLENAVETADSMKSRGYGLKGRTAFSVYCFTEKDKYLIIWLCFCGCYLLTGFLSGFLSWRYLPDMHGSPLTPFSVSFYAVYSALCVTPLIIDIREEKKWKSLQLKI